jgi:hypothetical protein
MREFIEQIELRMAGQNSQLCLTLKGALAGTLQIERTGPGQVELRLGAAWNAGQRATLQAALQSQGVQVSRWIHSGPQRGAEGPFRRRPADFEPIARTPPREPQRLANVVRAT